MAPQSVVRCALPSSPPPSHLCRHAKRAQTSKNVNSSKKKFQLTKVDWVGVLFIVIVALLLLINPNRLPLLPPTTPSINALCYTSWFLHWSFCKLLQSTSLNPPGHPFLIAAASTATINYPKLIKSTWTPTTCTCRGLKGCRIGGTIFITIWSGCAAAAASYSTIITTRNKLNGGSTWELNEWTNVKFTFGWVEWDRYMYAPHPPRGIR